MGCEFTATVSVASWSVTLTHKPDASNPVDPGFGPVEGRVELDDYGTLDIIGAWTPQTVNARLPAGAQQGTYILRIVTATNDSCVSQITIPTNPTEAATQIRAVPNPASLDSDIFLVAPEVTFTFVKATHAPLKLLDRAATEHFRWEGADATGWGTNSLKLRLPTPAQYPGYNPDAEGRAHTIRLGSTTHQPGLEILPGNAPPMPCEPDRFMDWANEMIRFDVMDPGNVDGNPDTIRAGDPVSAVVLPSTPNAGNLIAPLLHDAGSGWTFETALRVVRVPGQPVGPKVTSGNLSAGDVFSPASSATFLLPPTVDPNPAAGGVEHEVEVVGRLTTPATVCADKIVRKLQSIIIKQLPIHVPAVAIFFDHKIPPFAGSDHAGVALVAIKPGTMLDVGQGQFDKDNGNPRAIRDIVVSQLNVVVAALYKVAQTGFTVSDGIPLPPTVHLDRLQLHIAELAKAPDVAAVVQKETPDLGKVWYDALFDYSASGLPGSVFMVGPPGTRLRVFNDAGCKGSKQASLVVPPGSILADSPSLWRPNATQTNAIVETADPNLNLYNEIRSLRWT